MTTPKLHVKKGDTVVILSGKDKGKKGKIISCFPQDGKVVVEGVNIVKKHTRPTQRTPQGGIKEQEAPIRSSKVALVCPSCKKPTRVGKKILADGTRAKICRKCQETIER